MLAFFGQLGGAIAFTQLPKDQRRLVFYSEGKNYWVHLQGLVEECLATTIPVCYLSSDANDAGLKFRHSNYQGFQIGDGFVRSWLFENLEADVVVMTMPDLHRYQLKRSRHYVHYVYVHHSLVSSHMIYRDGAFDYYDTIFCCGPHHVKEMQALKATRIPGQINLVEHGYGRLDAIIDAARQLNLPHESPDQLKKILIAPSWGSQMTIESGIAEAIIGALLDQGYRVTLRPHPQTIKLAPSNINAILTKFSSSDLFVYEANVSGQTSLRESDVMISDWSGAALDFAFGLNKPVLFIDVPRKINNPDYKDINLDPIEVSIRDQIGMVLAENDLSRIGSHIENLIALGKTIDFKSLRDQFVFNVGQSSKVGAAQLLKILDEVA